MDTRSERAYLDPTSLRGPAMSRSYPAVVVRGLSVLVALFVSVASPLQLGDGGRDPESVFEPALVVVTTRGSALNGPSSTNRKVYTRGYRQAAQSVLWQFPGGEP
jgi:hypothetical protein